MVKETINGKEIYYDGFIQKEFVKLRDVIIKQDWDWITIIDGMEGSGKSTIAQQIAALVDPTFNINRIVFKADDFIHSVNNAKQYQAIVFDESFSSLASVDTITKTSKTLVKMLAEIRQKNLFLFFCCPTFFDLNKNVAMWRAKTLIHCYLDKNYRRGNFRLYTRTMKNDLYIYGKKYYNYHSLSSKHEKIRGKFCKSYVVDEEAYRKKKLEALRQYEENDEDSIHQSIKQRNLCMKEMAHRLRYTSSDFINLGIMLGRRHINTILGS